MQRWGILLRASERESFEEMREKLGAWVGNFNKNLSPVEELWLLSFFSFALGVISFAFGGCVLMVLVLLNWSPLSMCWVWPVS